jgi:hypothetical protein
VALHDDLLDLADRLVTLPAPPAAIPAVSLPAKTEAELRRGISTAYYALFHLLIDVTTARGVATAALRAHVARNFEHRNMKAVCKQYTFMVTDKAGQPVPPEIQHISVAFVQLQEARHKADYDVTNTVTPLDAQTKVQMVKTAFNDWATVAVHPASDAFLTELLVGGIKDR